MIRRDIWNNSLRGEFGFRLYEAMREDKKIILLTADLGFGLFNNLREDMPKQFINVGASEHALLDISVGLALSGKIPIAYSITPFLIYRGFETIRTYINHENIPVKLIGSGRNDDYKHDGFSHDASDIQLFMSGFDDIDTYWPNTNNELSSMMSEMLYNGKPTFLSLRR